MSHAEHPWQVTAENPPTPGGVLSLLGVALALLLGSAATKAEGMDPLHQELASTASQLKQAWLNDPVSRQLPFPSLQILKEPGSIRAACPERSNLRMATGSSVYCPSRDTILIDLSAFEGDSDSRRWPLRYWIAIGLAEAITSRSSNPGTISASTSPAVSSLENHCIAGILLAASRLTARQPAEVILAPALLAYPLSKDPLVGSHGQRGYALLTGLGATDLSCSPVDMQSLSQNRVPDPDVLERISQLLRANTSLMAVLNSQCRPRPRAACPRRLNARTPSL